MVAARKRLPSRKTDAMFFLRMRDFGKILITLGSLMVLLGFALWSGFGAGWLGRLPGDIRIERGHSAFYFPIVTCIIISIVLSVILSLFRR
jgi:ribose/xylose/arabinose/galactoside ABC-type transport system permease subunit